MALYFEKNAPDAYDQDIQSVAVSGYLGQRTIDRAAPTRALMPTPQSVNQPLITAPNEQSACAVLSLTGIPQSVKHSETGDLSEVVWPGGLTIKVPRAQMPKRLACKIDAILIDSYWRSTSCIAFQSVDSVPSAVPGQNHIQNHIQAVHSATVKAATHAPALSAAPPPATAPVSTHAVPSISADLVSPLVTPHSAQAPLPLAQPSTSRTTTAKAVVPPAVTTSVSVDAPAKSPIAPTTRPDAHPAASAMQTKPSGTSFAALMAAQNGQRAVQQPKARYVPKPPPPTRQDADGTSTHSIPSPASAPTPAQSLPMRPKFDSNAPAVDFEDVPF